VAPRGIAENRLSPSAEDSHACPNSEVWEGVVGRSIFGPGTSQDAEQERDRQSLSDHDVALFCCWQANAEPPAGLTASLHGETRSRPIAQLVCEFLFDPLAKPLGPLRQPHALRIREHGDPPP